MFKYGIKDEGIALDDESQGLGNEGIACTPMTTFKFITKEKKALHQ